MASEYFYQGKGYALDPIYSNSMTPFSGYNANFSSIGSAVDARTANQLKEVSEHLNTGIKTIEVGPVQPDVFESIPTQHFAEMRRAAKLAGAELTFHAPMIDPTGITEQGWNKLAQDSAEKQLWDAIKKGAELNPEKGTVVTFHASSVGLPGAEIKLKEGKQEKTKSVIIINTSDGKIAQIKEEERYFESKGANKKAEFNPEEELKRINEDAWMQKVSQVNYYAERASDIVEARTQQLESYKNLPEKGKESMPEFEKMHKDKEKLERDLINGKIYLRDSYRNLRELYDDVYKTASPEQQKLLQGFAEKVKPFVEEKRFQELQKNPEDLKSFAQTIEEGVKIMGEIRPKMYTQIRDFAVEKSAETTANLALKSYNEFVKNGKAAPIIALENHPAQQSLLTTGEDLRDVIKSAQNKFVEQATKQGLSESEAKKQAEKLIGATWDVGHINMLRRYGYDKADILEQTKAVAPYVKKIHLADNFGFEHTELPMGMGNVPFKEMMAELSKSGKLGKDGYDVKKIIEAGNWWQHFSGGSKAGGPLMATLGNLSPNLYSGSYSGQNPIWSQAYGAMGGYFSGFGTMLPEQNFQSYGAGFSSLPTELGGQMPQGKDRFSGTPMA